MQFKYLNQSLIFSGEHCQFYFFQTLQELLQTMKNNFDNSLENLEEKEILLKHARFGRLVTKIFLFSIYYIEIIMVIIPMVLGRHSDPARLNRYPLCAWYYWDQDSNIFYVFAYILQVCTLKCFCNIADFQFSEKRLCQPISI